MHACPLPQKHRTPVQKHSQIFSPCSIKSVTPLKMNLKKLRNEILMECKANLNMLIPKHFINIDSNSPPPTLCWLAVECCSHRGSRCNDGLWWINVELFISD